MTTLRCTPPLESASTRSKSAGLDPQEHPSGGATETIACDRERLSVPFAAHRVLLNMSGSDYSGSDFSGSDDEYVGPKGGSSAAAARKMIQAQQQQAKKSERKTQAWERRGGDSSEEEEYIPTFEEIEDNEVPEQSIQQMEEERKRKRYVQNMRPCILCSWANSASG